METQVIIHTVELNVRALTTIFPLGLQAPDLHGLR